MVKGDTLRLRGSASPPAGAEGPPIREVFVFVGDRKVFYRRAPEGAGARPFAFEVDVRSGGRGGAARFALTSCA